MAHADEFEFFSLMITAFQKIQEMKMIVRSWLTAFLYWYEFKGWSGRAYRWMLEGILLGIIVLCNSIYKLNIWDAHNYLDKCSDTG